MEHTEALLPWTLPDLETFQGDVPGLLDQLRCRHPLPKYLAILDGLPHIDIDGRQTKGEIVKNDICHCFDEDDGGDEQLDASIAAKSAYARQTSELRELLLELQKEDTPLVALSLPFQMGASAYADTGLGAGGFAIRWADTIHIHFEKGSESSESGTLMDAAEALAFQLANYVCFRNTGTLSLGFHPSHVPTFDGVDLRHLLQKLSFLVPDLETVLVYEGDGPNPKDHVLVHHWRVELVPVVIHSQLVS